MVYFSRRTCITYMGFLFHPHVYAKFARRKRKVLYFSSSVLATCRFYIMWRRPRWRRDGFHVPSMTRATFEAECEAYQAANGNSLVPRRVKALLWVGAPSRLSATNALPSTTSRRCALATKERKMCHRRRRRPKMKADMCMPVRNTVSSFVAARTW